MKLAISPTPEMDWPQLDRSLWTKAQTKGGLFNKGGVAAGWRPATLVKAERGYSTWLAWLKAQGDLDPGILPVERLTKSQLKAFIDDYKEGRAEYTVATIVCGMIDFLRAVQPDADLSWASRLAYRMMNSATPSREKTPRLVPVAELSDLGLALMDEGQDMLEKGQVSGARVYRDGLMIAFLSARPIRLLNLTGLQIGRTLLFDGDCFRIAFPNEEMKNHRRLDVPLPDWLTPHLEYYIETCRPILMRRSKGHDEGWLWINRRGRPMRAGNIYTRITKLTKQRLGRVISPHLFRDCAATDVAIHDPAHVGIIKSVLGHSTLAMAEKHYNQATSLEAARKHQAMISEFRK